MRYIDLTMPLSEETPVFSSATPRVLITPLATMKTNGSNELLLKLSTHSATHIDAPFHMMENGKKLDEFGIETFVGDAIVIDCFNQQEISISEDDFQRIRENDIVFFYTGHSNDYASEKYTSAYPVISKGTADKLVSKKVKMVGIDTLSPDRAPFEVHQILLSKEILIVENLVNLAHLVDKRFTACVLPLKIKDSDGAPCRVIAMVD